MNTEREILNNPIFRICWTLFIAALLLGVPMVAGIIASTLDYSAVDPDGTFAWIIVHHLVQAIIFLVIIVGLRRITPLGFGLTRGNEQVGSNMSVDSPWFSAYVPLFLWPSCFSQIRSNHFIIP